MSQFATVLAYKRGLMHLEDTEEAERAKASEHIEKDYLKFVGIRKSLKHQDGLNLPRLKEILLKLVIFLHSNPGNSVGLDDALSVANTLQNLLNIPIDSSGIISILEERN